jgi:Recombination directionality factor-like
MTVPTPIGQLDYRLPQAGRIRTGEKVWNAKRQKYLPTTLDHFRFTSGDGGLIEFVAQRYGGKAEKWEAQGSGDKWKVDTEADSIDVIVAVPKGFTLSYEMWDPHLIRRCNGTTCDVLVGTPDDAQMQQMDCLCARRGEVECDMKLRLSVLMPGMPTLGTWRWDTESDNAIKEIRGVFKALHDWVGPGLHPCKMRLEERRQPRKKFKVVVLDPGISIESLVAGDARLVQLPAPSSPTVAELGAGASSVTRPTSTPEAGEPMAGGARGDGRPAPDDSPLASPPTDDDDIVDAEVVEDDLRDWLDKLPQTHRNAALRKAREIARQHGEPEPTVAAAIPDHILQQLKEQVEAGDDARVRTTSE